MKTRPLSLYRNIPQLNGEENGARQASYRRSSPAPPQSGLPSEAPDIANVPQALATLGELYQGRECHILSTEVLEQRWEIYRGFILGLYKARFSSCDTEHAMLF